MSLSSNSICSPLERGSYGRVSIEAVARAAGIRRPIVYGHFRDLPGLLEALVERETVRALTQLAEVLPTELREGDPRDLLVWSLRGYLGVVVADPLTWRLVLMPPEGAPKALHAQIEQGREAIVTQLASALSAGFGPGREPPDPELTARMLSSFADEGARLVLTQPRRFPVERVLAVARWFLEQVDDATGGSRPRTPGAA